MNSQCDILKPLSPNLMILLIMDAHKKPNKCGKLTKCEKKQKKVVLYIDGDVMETFMY